MTDPATELQARGLRSGELILVVDAQGQGKTTFTVQTLRTDAPDGTHVVLFF